MDDIKIIIKNAFGKDFVVSTEQIEEDVLRQRMGLKPHDTDCGTNIRGVTDR